MLTPARCSRDLSLTVHSAGSPLPFATPDIYFTQAYGLAEELAGAGQWLSISSYEGRWQLPIHIRDIDGCRDAVSPYGYAGVFSHADLSQRDHEQAWTLAGRDFESAAS